MKLTNDILADEGLCAVRSYAKLLTTTVKESPKCEQKKEGNVKPSVSVSVSVSVGVSQQGQQGQQAKKVDCKDKETEVPYGRWSLRDDATVDYGHFHKTGGVGISEGTAEKAFYLTTAINYTNGPAHMGHAYEATTSDALSRFERLKGDGPVYFVTGADEHGQKIANTAADIGQQPIQICDKVCTCATRTRSRLCIVNCNCNCT